MTWRLGRRPPRIGSWDLVRLGVATVALIGSLVGERILGTLVRALYRLSGFPGLDGVLFRSRDLYDADYYIALVQGRLLDISPLLLAGGLLLLLLASPAVRRIERTISTLAEQVVRRPAAMAGVAVLFSIVVRSGTIAVPSLIDWDENTFLTVAQRLSVGELPFIQTLDNKPPLLALQQAIPFLVGLAHPSWIRFALAVLVGVTGFLVGTAVRAGGGTPTGALLGASAFIVGASVAPSGGAWMSHHSANLLLALLMVVAVHVDTRRHATKAFVIGVLVAAVTLTRTNYVIPAGIVAAAVIWGGARVERLRRAGVTSLGAFGVAAAIVLPYVVVGGLANLRYGLLDLLLGPGGRAAEVGALTRIPLWMPLLVVLSLLLWIRARQQLLLRPAERIEARAVPPGSLAIPCHNIAALAMLGIVISLALHASMFDHYAGMLMVPLGIQAGLIARGSAPTGSAWPSVPARLVEKSLAPVAALSTLMLLLSGSSGLAPSEAGRNAWRVERQVVRELETRILSRPGDVLALDHHYVYWRIGVAPSAPFAVHPANIVVEPFWKGVHLQGTWVSPSSPFEAVTAALDGRPRYLIASPGLTESYLAEALTIDEIRLVRQHIDQHWEIVWTSSDARAAIRSCVTCD